MGLQNLACPLLLVNKHGEHFRYGTFGITHPVHPDHSLNHVNTSYVYIPDHHSNLKMDNFLLHNLTKLYLTGHECIYGTLSRSIESIKCNV